MLIPDLSHIPPGLQLGTSSFSSPDWCGVFYPNGLPPTEFLSYYAGKLRTVEIDATWHAMPSRRTVEAWSNKVPDGFVFSLKAPRIVTHDRYLEGCEEEWKHFLGLIKLLGDKLGPVLFQFPYVARGANPEEYRTGADFRRRLEAFLPLVPGGIRVVVEVRNRSWVGEPLCDLLRSRGVALALVDYYTMPSGAELMSRIDPVTADFGYIRFLGHHQAMDQRVFRAREQGLRSRDWSELIVDRSAETRAWIPPIRDLLRRVPVVFAYFNNHYAGFAPGSLDLFVRLWDEEMARQDSAPTGSGQLTSRESE